MLGCPARERPGPGSRVLCWVVSEQKALQQMGFPWDWGSASSLPGLSDSNNSAELEQSPSH